MIEGGRFSTPEQVATTALLAALTKLDVRLLVVRASAEPVDRLRAVAKAVESDAWRVARLLGDFPSLRAFVVFGDIT